MKPTVAAKQSDGSERETPASRQSADERSTPTPSSYARHLSPIDGGEEGRELMRAGIFLSLRRGERWRREAATEWGKALMKPTVAASGKQAIGRM
ncbi:hypothetical protein NKH85_27120 [Mesorhizobium sp. M0924]|uniref:hypothetical protein n=1 Tax=Mesorhizobium sp. M0924 TaxID=2957029 RepID=UPI003335FA3C